MSHQPVDGKYSSNHDIYLPSGPPPPYDYGNEYGAPSRGTRWDPRRWSRKSKIGAAFAIVIFIIVIITVPVDLAEQPLSQLQQAELSATGYV